jgi:predicted ATP-dependent Lon-type protease
MGNSRIRKTKHITFMSKPKLNDEEITQRGRELYQNIIRPKVETPENIGKIISMNVETGEYEIDDDLLITTLRLRTKQADAALWTERIGFNAVYTVGGTLVRTDP